MDMDKFTKYAIYFLIGIIGYYLLFNNEMVEGFKSNSPEYYQFNVDKTGTGEQTVPAVEVILKRYIYTADMKKPSIAATIEDKKFTICKKLLETIQLPNIETNEENTAVFYMSTDTVFTYVMLNYTKSTASPTNIKVAAVDATCVATDDTVDTVVCPSVSESSTADTCNGSCTFTAYVSESDLDAGIYILKYPTSIEFADIADTHLPQDVAKIEIYKIENIDDTLKKMTVPNPKTFVTTTAKLKEISASEDDDGAICTPNPCQNNGSCTPSSVSHLPFTCMCKDGYKGYICDIAYITDPDPDPNPITTKCAKSHDCDEFGIVSNASKTCASTICTDDECCTDTDWELYGGIFCCCVFFIAFIVGILYLFTSRSIHKQRGKIYKGELEKVQT